MHPIGHLAPEVRKRRVVKERRTPATSESDLRRTTWGLGYGGRAIFVAGHESECSMSGRGKKYTVHPGFQTTSAGQHWGDCNTFCEP
jgi:hypothetical protein